MAEPTHDEHLTQIRDRSRRLAEIPLETSASNYIMRDMIDSIGDVRWLLEQLEQQQTLAATELETANADADHFVDRRDNYRETITGLQAANADLRAQLAVIGETREEWAADGPAGWFQWPAAARSEWSERFARGVVEGAAEKGVEVKLKRRLVGGWRDAE